MRCSHAQCFLQSTQFKASTEAGSSKGRLIFQFSFVSLTLSGVSSEGLLFEKVKTQKSAPPEAIKFT